MISKTINIIILALLSCSTSLSSQEFELNPEPPVPRPKIEIDPIKWSFDKELLEQLKKEHPNGLFQDNRNGGFTHFSVEKDGKKIFLGPIANWHLNGRLAQLTPHDLKVGVLHGKAYEWYDDGGLMSIKNHVMGREVGRETTWYKNGVSKTDHIDSREENGVIKIREWHKNGIMSNYKYTIDYPKEDYITLKVAGMTLTFVSRFHQKKWDEQGRVTLDEMSLAGIQTEEGIRYTLLYENGKMVYLEKANMRTFKLIENIKLD